MAGDTPNLVRISTGFCAFRMLLNQYGNPIILLLQRKIETVLLAPRITLVSRVLLTVNFLQEG
jgi:hypothetical protein